MTTSWLDSPATVLADASYFRVARSDQPLAFSAIQPADAHLQFAGNRFDVLGGGVLYLATTARGCYAETIARFRPSARVRAAVGDEPGFLMCGGISADWRARRLEVEVELPEALPFVDVESPQTHAYLTAVMAPQLVGLGVDALDVGIVRGSNRLITRAIAAWAYAVTDSVFRCTPVCDTCPDWARRNAGPCSTAHCWTSGHAPPSNVPTRPWRPSL